MVSDINSDEEEKEEKTLSNVWIPGVNKLESDEVLTYEPSGM